MDGYPPATYGESFADVYDDWYGDVSDVEATVACLRSLAGRGRVCELGVGTGRLALPLARSGVDLVGVDASPSMLAALRAKPRGPAVPVVRADLAALPFRAGAGFAIVFAAYNTLFNVDTDEGQEACVRDAAALLDPGGLLVLEAFVPDDDAPDGPGPLEVRSVEADRVVLTACVRDAADGTLTGQHIDLTDDGVRLRPWRLRYRSPDELDELAATAGLEAHYRWADWAGTPFGPDDPVHVSVYRKPSA